MIYELIKTWIDSPASVTLNEIESAQQQMLTQLPTGPNLCLIAALSLIENNGIDAVEQVRKRIRKYEQENNS